MSGNITNSSGDITESNGDTTDARRIILDVFRRLIHLSLVAGAKARRSIWKNLNVIKANIMADYIPEPDAKFDGYVRITLAPFINTNYLALGLTAAENTSFQAAATAWGAAWTAFTTIDAAWQAAQVDKVKRRAVLEALARQLVQKIQSNPQVTDAQKGTLGVTIRKKTKTPVGVPASMPVLTRADTSTRCVLRLFFMDATTPESKARPPGVKSCEIREQIGGVAPVDPEGMPFLAIATRAPYVAEFTAEDVGQTVYFAFRWLNSRGQPGPWSQVHRAVCPG